MQRQLSKLEYLILPILLAAIYFLPLQEGVLPLFAGQLNSIDGSLYFSRGVDLVLSWAMVLICLRFFIPRVLESRMLARLVLGVVGLLVLVSFLETALDYMTLLAFNLPTAPDQVSDKMLAFPNRELVRFTVWPGNGLIILLSILYGLSRDRVVQIRQEASIQQEKLESEIKYLKSQINPHFLFNTLNNIYAITQRNQETRTGAAIMGLSDLMRYMLYESDSHEVSLSREVEHLKAYIELMLLKYAADDPLVIETAFEGNLEAVSLAPLLLLPLVENAFKHGVSTKGEGHIIINLDVREKQIAFKIANTMNSHEDTQEHHGVGLENLKRRLELLYPDSHSFQIENDGDNYAVQLTIEKRS
jgi:sensor histidine kinase YesM